MDAVVNTRAGMKRKLAALTDRRRFRINLCEEHPVETGGTLSPGKRGRVSPLLFPATRYRLLTFDMGGFDGLLLEVHAATEVRRAGLQLFR
jgi:hypothetical protein